MSSTLVTDPPDSDCIMCFGRGVLGGCGKLSCNHMHTYSFCRCVNERYEQAPVCFKCETGMTHPFHDDGTPADQTFWLLEDEEDFSRNV